MFKISFPKNSNSGFTLVEMLVAMFILMIIVMGSTGIYTYSIKAQRRTVEMTLVAQDIQFLMTTLSRNIRAGYIDYAYYGGTVDPDVPQERLALYDPERNSGVVYKQINSDQVGACFCDHGRCALGTCLTNDDFIGITTHRLKLTIPSRSDPTDPTSLVVPKIEQSGLLFFISPASSPFASDDPIQPRVTISLNAIGAGENLTVQQTIPQRFFERK